MGYEESFITMKLIWHSYLVPSLAIWVHETPIETGLVINLNVKINSANALWEY